MIDFNEMAIFTRVVEAGTFSGAARELGLPKSTVSRKIASLEARLGTRLLNRTTRAVSPTEAGAAHYERCARVVAEAEAAEREIAHLQEAPRGLLRVSAPVDLGDSLGRLVTAYLAAYPEVRIVLDLSNRVVDLVEEGFDIALRAGQLADSSLVARRLGNGPRLVVASPAYLDTHGTPEAPQALRDHRCLLYGTHDSRQTLRFDGAAGHASITLEPYLTANNMAVLRDVALAGAGIAVIPGSLCGEALADGRLRPLLGDWSLGANGLFAVYPSPRHLTPKVRSFIDFLAEHGTF